MSLVTFVETPLYAECYVDDDLLIAEIMWDDMVGDYQVNTVVENYIHYEHLLQIVEHIKEMEGE